MALASLARWRSAFAVLELNRDDGAGAEEAVGREL